MFSKQWQELGESILNYTVWLREKGKDCEFSPQTYDRILKQLIQTIKDNLIKKSVQKRWILDHFLEEASQKEDVNQQKTQKRITKSPKWNINGENLREMLEEVQDTQAY